MESRWESKLFQHIILISVSVSLPTENFGFTINSSRQLPASSKDFFVSSSILSHFFPIDHSGWFLVPWATKPEQIIKLTELIDVSHFEQPEGSTLSHGLTKANYLIKFHITEPLITSEIKVKHRELQRHDEWDLRVLCWIFRHTASGAVRWNVRLACDLKWIFARNTLTRGTLVFNRRFKFPLLGATFLDGIFCRTKPSELKTP